MMKICIEGPTGAGKSTLSKLLIEQWGAVLCPTVNYFTDGDFPICEKISDINSNFECFLQGEIQAENWMGQKLYPCVQDRNWVSQFTFLMALQNVCGVNVDSLIRRLWDELSRGNIDFPDVFIFIQCSPDLTRIRRARRGATPWGDVPPWVKESLKADFRIERYKAYSFFENEIFNNSILIDASEMKEVNDIPRTLTILPTRRNRKQMKNNLEGWVNL